MQQSKTRISWNARATGRRFGPIKRSVSSACVTSHGSEYPKAVVS